MKTYFIMIALVVLASSVSAQSLKDSLFSGKLKNDLGKTAVSKDTGKTIPVTRNETISAKPAGGEVKKPEANKPEAIKADDATAKASGEYMPDSLNKLYHAKQKYWKRFVEINTPIITEKADDNRKVKKGEYLIEISYEIGLNGRITTNEITCTPHNEHLIQYATEFMARPPVLAPPIYNDGKPRKELRVQPITIIKK